MYIQRRLGQRRFLIIGILVSPVSTTKGGGPYEELFLKDAFTLEYKSKM